MPDHNPKNLSDQEIEAMIAKAVAKQVPDICRQASEAPIIPQEMVDDILPRQFPRRNLWRRRLIAALFLLCLCAGGIFAYTWFSVRAIVSIDINPAVSLSLNRYEYVIDAQPLNDDGADVLNDLSLKRLDLDTALNALIGAMNRKGYLAEGGAASVFVSGDDEEYNQKLYEQISDDLAHLAPSVTTSPSEQAPSSETVQQETTLPSEDTQKETTPPSEQAPSSETVQQETTLPSSSSGTAISMAQAQQLALQKAGLPEKDVVWKKIEQDEDDGIIIYELEFISGHTEYECEIDAATGAFLKFEQEID